MFISQWPFLDIRSTVSIALLISKKNKQCLVRFCSNNKNLTYFSMLCPNNKQYKSKHCICNNRKKYKAKCSHYILWYCIANNYGRILKANLS